MRFKSLKTVLIGVLSMPDDKVVEGKKKSKSVDFLHAIVDEDLKTNKYSGKVITRFPPEPNGFLHIGHAKSICINFGIANDYEGGICHLRFDDTDPTKEDFKYVDSIKQDVRWLGFDWYDKLFFASDYYQKLYEYAIVLIEKGLAYVCSLNEDKIREYRGTITEPGKESPYRNRSVEENLKLFKQMKNGDFKDGEHVLRAKIDMTSANMKMRDPLLYRIRHDSHYRTGDEWCLYPMYDFAHCLSDAMECITHSICTLEFENNRELYDWVLEAVEFPKPRPKQYEFARLNLNYTVMSKRKLLYLVESGLVDGWDDPRLPTISGLRRRGVSPEAIKNFCNSIGVAKSNSIVDMAQLEFCIRDDLNTKVPRVLCVLNPLKVVIENYPEDKEEILDAPYYPHDVPKEGSRAVPFAREIYIEKEDFNENPPKGFYRLAPGKEVRLRHAYLIKCEKVIKDLNTGEITELRCSYDPASKSGADTSGKKVKGTIHWASKKHAKPVEVRLYDRLFNVEHPGDNIEKDMNPDSLKVLKTSFVEPAVADFAPSSSFQFERQGYFYLDPISTTKEKLVFNRTVSLKDSWARSVKQKERKLPELKKESKKTPVKQPQQQKVENSFTQSIEDMSSVELKRFKKYKNELNVPNDNAAIIAKDKFLTNLFEESIAVYNNGASISNWIVNDILRELKDNDNKKLLFDGKQLADLACIVDKEEISNKIGKDILDIMLKQGGSPLDIIEKQNLKQLNDPKEIEPVVEQVIKENPDNLAKYKSGRTNLLGFFVGQVIKKTAGKANPKITNRIVQKKLSE